LRRNYWAESSLDTKQLYTQNLHPLLCRETYQLCILVGSLGLLFVLLILTFGLRLLRAEEDAFLRIYSDAMRAFWSGSPTTRPMLPRLAVEAQADRLQRRNEFWTSYGQIVIAALIIIVLTILLITKTITAEAGLPILSAVSGFALAKGVTGARSQVTPPEEGQ
jgi:hypothetical protein